MANILMINVPYAGHTNPTLPLAARLVVELKIGRRMRAVFTNSAMIYKNAVAVLNDENYKNNARRVSNNIHSGTQLEEAIERIEKCVKQCC